MLLHQARAVSESEPPEAIVLREVLVANGVDPAAAVIRLVEWRRTERFVGVSTTFALLGGTYACYASGERKSEIVIVELTDKGTGRSLGRLRLSEGTATAARDVRLESASIILATVDVDESVLRRRVSRYGVAMAFVRRPAAE